MRIAVIGAGTMGAGVAQLAAMNGHDVAARDVTQEQLDRAGASITTSLERFAKKDRLAAGDDVPAVEARLSLTTDVAEAVRGADVVIEAVPEVLELKHEVLAQVLDAAPADALIGTNTSQLSITRIAAPFGDDAERIVGVHFFNPPVMMQLVELIAGLRTTDATLGRARDFAESLGRETVTCLKDSPGFITSRAYAILRLECLRMLEEGVATPEDIDKAMRLGFNFPMGPLELGDMNGLDTYLHAISALAEAHGDRFRPTVGLRNMVAAGRLGRKSGAGFYDYDTPTRSTT